MSADNRGWRAIPHNMDCPICGHRGTYCTVAPDGDAIQCRRVESPHPVKNRDGTAGWMHPVPEADRPRTAALPAKAKVPKRSPAEWANLVRQLRTALSPRRLERFADSLGVTPESLKAYGVGYDASTGCFTWPMYDGRQSVIGVRIRSYDGQVQACVRGSSNGLFIPDGIDFRSHDPETRLSNLSPLLLLLPEGPTDAAAAWDLSITAVGRPNGSSGLLMLRQLLSSTPHKQEVVVVGENDGPVWPHVPSPQPIFPGVAGALACAKALLDYAGTLRLVMPPRHAKDFRDWKLAGCTAADVALAVGRAAKIDAAWLGRAEATLERRKRQAVELFGRMCERLADYASRDEATKVERLRAWMRRRGYPVDAQRKAAA